MMSVIVSNAVWKNFDGAKRRNLKLTLLAAADYADNSGGRVFPAVATIAAKTGCSAKQARRELQALVDLGFLMVVEKGGGRQLTRHYQVNMDRLNTPTDGSDLFDNTPTHGSDLFEKHSHPCPINTPTHGSLVVNEPSVVLKAERPSRDGQNGFVHFWAAYPNKQKKKRAIDAWNKLNPSRELLETILVAVAAFANSADWRKEGGRYVPHPSSWIHDRRWEDELKPSGERDWTKHVGPGAPV